MAWEQPLFGLGQFKALANYSSASNQYRVVQGSSAADTFKLLTAVDVVPLGILQDTPAAGEAGQIAVLGVSKVRVNSTAAAAITFMQPLIASTVGGLGGVIGGSIATTNYIIGHALEAHSSESKGIISCLLTGPSVGTT